MHRSRHMGGIAHEIPCNYLSLKSRRRSIFLLTATLVMGLWQAPSALRAQRGLQRKGALVKHELWEIDSTFSAEVVTLASIQPSSSPIRGALSAWVAPAVVQPPLIELSPDIEPLRTDFNRSASSTRLLLILSPS